MASSKLTQARHDFAHSATAISAAGTPKAAAPPSDLSGVWRRVRRPPDKLRKYTIYELAFSLTNVVPPMTPFKPAGLTFAKLV